MSMGSTIIPIASGKGGVGKTFFTANLAVALAQMGHPTVAVDMDLGGSNLHSFLGLPNRYPGIGDFLKARGGKLEEMLIPTKTSDLKLLPGDGLSPFLANIPYAQKQRLISNIKKLTAKYVLLDLSAGTSYNTLDFFRISPHGIVLTIPEYPSIMSMLGFLKHFSLRLIERTFTRNHQIRDLLHSSYKQPIMDQQANMKALESRITAIDRKAGDTLTEMRHAYRPRVVFNMGVHPDEIKIAEQISNSLERSLSISADYFGFIFEDPSVRESIKRRTLLFPQYRENMAARCIVRIADRIVKFWERPVKDSAQLLLNRVRELYESRS